MMKNPMSSKIVKHKFNAVKCTQDDKKFPSKLERDYYNYLKMQVQKGEVIFFLRQPCFDIGGGVRYYADFVVFNADGSVEFVDTKGKDTAISIAKRKLVESIYPIEIKIVRKVN